ncbi:hypothetical protein ACFQ6Q_17255 [Streptomyces sp. NPDC056437]|uniref:hypothetical protein n=1 Tax=Streptomyces sp. NPDC056437 TaxID=3345816 RepID=UPI00368290EA
MRTALGFVLPDSGQVSFAGVPIGRLGNLAGLVGASTLPTGWRAHTRRADR